MPKDEPTIYSRLGTIERQIHQMQVKNDMLYQALLGLIQQDAESELLKHLAHKMDEVANDGMKAQDRSLHSLHIKVDDLSHQNMLLIAHLAQSDLDRLHDKTVVQLLMGEICKKLGIDPRPSFAQAQQIVDANANRLKEVASHARPQVKRN